MLNPVYNNEPVDMFVAGSSAAAKQVAIQRAKDIGLAKCMILAATIHSIDRTVCHVPDKPCRYSKAWKRYCVEGSTQAPGLMCRNKIYTGYFEME